MELIGKQIAIETILGQPPELHYPSWYAAQIEKLPPAPPEYLAEQAGILVTDSDTISRQAAISAICNACGKIDCDKMDKCEKLQLPPANCSEFPNNSDTISRKWLMECVDEGWIKFDTEKDKNIYVHLVRDIAPSAQPERTCVNCGRTVNNGGWYADGRTRCPIEEHYALQKDGYCHLWEKRNVTDDDYPERRTDE